MKCKQNSHHPAQGYLFLISLETFYLHLSFSKADIPHFIYSGNGSKSKEKRENFAILGIISFNQIMLEASGHPFLVAFKQREA